VILGPGEAAPMVSDLLVAQFADDDIGDNANTALQLLEEMGPDSEPSLLAGLEAGLELEDWQLIQYSSRALAARDAGFEFGTIPEFMEVMAAQLRDDAVDGNAAAGREYLWRCGPRAKPLLERLVAEGDEQQRRYARVLLAELD